MFLQGCMPASNSRTGTTSSEESSESTTNDPTFSTTKSFFQYAGIDYYTTISVKNTFSDTILLKGSGIHTYLKTYESSVVCAILTFSSIPTGSKNVVVAGLPRTKTNLSANTKENYFSLNFKASESDINQAYCNNSQINNYISSNLSGTTVYSVTDICPTCSSTTYSSSYLRVLTVDGEYISTLNQKNLNLKVTYNASSSTDTSGCSLDSECQTQGYDCCLSGQCVTDGTLITTYSSADAEYADYLAALLDVSKNSSNKSKYPQFYYICSQSSSDSDSDEDTTGELTPEEKALQLKLELKYLYECTTPLVGEMSICTQKYEDALSTGSPFYSGTDDSDFSSVYTGSKAPTYSVTEILYQNETLYNKDTLTTPSNVSLTGSNDNLYDKMTITLSQSLDTDNNFRDLDIRYMIDGSCTKINSILAKCYKVYNQGQNSGLVTDHWPASNNFKVPKYADTSRDILVYVDDTLKNQISESDASLTENKNNINNWYLYTTTSPKQIRFSYSNLAVQTNQLVKIVFYVNLNDYDVMASKQTALTRIGELCACPNLDCTLTPVVDTNDVIQNYECKYPDSSTTAPLQQQVIVSTKNVAHRHFDTTGVAKTDLTANDVYSTPALEQEGEAFKYTNNDLLKPNNISTYIGFNEIYGSFNYATSAALPAKQITVNKGTTYDITASGGYFSSCYNCGTDYYSTLLKLFPDNFTLGAGGYKPYTTASSKLSPTSDSPRADDLLFGRACFVPVTMLPWSHRDRSDIQTQRKERLKTQHFMFANGYSRDWYGFDYGSLIGSFDGVKWFSVGTKRRIKATSNKLFLAINSYFADLNTDSSYTVLVQDSVINGTVTYPTTDYESDGAQCQQVHACSTDSDCASALGWEYACENVSGITSRYPSFDNNANEIYNPTSNPLSLISLNGSYTGSSKRCVYRGKGSLCHQDYSTISADSSYAGVQSARINGCNANFYCQDLTASSLPSVFNNKINRYGKSVKIRNAQTDAIEVTSFGLQTPLIGRGETYVGTNAIESIVKSNLNNNNVEGICLPGRNVASTSTFEILSSLSPSNQGDVVNNQGKTKTISAITGLNSTLYNVCPTFNTDGNYVNYDMATTANNNAEITNLSGMQNLSTSLLDIFSNQSLISDSISKNFESNKISAIALNQNSCLRAPGSTCFTDFDCGPSKYIANKVKSLTDSDLSNFMSIYELFFWQEDLVCSQPAKTTSESFDIRNNRCCREIDKKITIPTVNTNNIVETARDLSSAQVKTLQNVSIPGQTLNINNASRYSRASSLSVSNLLPSDYKPLSVAVNDSCTTTTGTAGCADVSLTSSQYKTIDFTAKRTCCSENWVREFQSSTSGLPSGHDWKPEKFQQIDVSNFSCLNYTDDTKKNCEDPGNTDLCTQRAISEAEANTILSWVSNFELLGIPNVMIEDPQANASGDFNCETSSSTIPGFVSSSAYLAEYTDTSTNYLKANDTTNFDSTMKQIFSADTFTCCQPAGTEIADTESESMCCTGYVNPNTKKCALRNYIDVSLYLNKYVSSEAQSLSESLFDEKTGYIKDASVAAQVACEKNLCASGYLAYGVAYGKYEFNNVGDDVQDAERYVLKFIENTSDDNYIGFSDLFDAGLKWNNHIYCVPQEVATKLVSEANLVVFSCN